AALRQLAQGLSAVAAHLEPKEASEAAAAFVHAMTKTTNLYVPMWLDGGIGVFMVRWASAPSLSALLTGVDLDQQRQRAAAVVALVGVTAGSQRTLPSLPFLTLAVKPLPCRLSDQELVDLLKHPLFVGEARRMILDLLGE